MLTIGDEALLALWMLARPLARPGPRCSRVAAGLSLIRAYPSAAPVTTPSNRPSTQRMPSTRSRAATKCISEVPGLAKHTLTPPPTKVRTRLSAPFIKLSPKTCATRTSMPAVRPHRKPGMRLDRLGVPSEARSLRQPRGRAAGLRDEADWHVVVRKMSAAGPVKRLRTGVGPP